MKRTLLSLAVVSSFLIAAPAFANDCIDHIDSHYYKTIHFPDQKVAGDLILGDCHLQDSDIPAVVAFLKQHPEANYIQLNGNHIRHEGAALLSQINNPIEYLYMSDNNIGDEGLQALAHMPVLRVLFASYNNITDAGAKSINFNKSLEILNLQYNHITPEGAKALNTMPSLQYLGLGSNQLLGDETAILFSHNHNLYGVDLSESEVTDTGALALASSPNLGEIELDSTKISSVGAKAIASKPNLDYVSLNYDHIGIETITALAKNPGVYNVSVSGNNLGDHEIEILAHNPHIEGFALYDNRIGFEGASTLAGSNARYVYMGKNYLGDEGAVALSHASSIHFLDVSNNGIGAKGAASLGKMSLWYLVANDNYIGDEGVERLISSWGKFYSPELFLSNNQISDTGAIALSKLSNQGVIIPYLDIRYNHISHVGLTALKNSSAIESFIAEGNDNQLKTTVKQKYNKASHLLSKTALFKHYCADKNNAYCTKLAEHHFIDSAFLDRE